MSPLVTYSLARLGFFLVPLAVLLLLGFDWVWGAVIATIIALALSMLTLRGLRQRAADKLQRRTEKPEKDRDSDTEDRQVDAPRP